MRAWRQFSLVIVGLVVAALAGSASWMIHADPFWAFRKDPPWLAATGGRNRVLDTEDRRAKPLQFILREPPDTVLIGSSATYRGIDPDRALGAGHAFNFGLSSLTSRELPTLASLVASHPEVRHVIVGLDYFAFTRFSPPVKVSDSLAGAAGRAHHVLTSLLSWRSLESSATAVVAATLEGGAWKRNGFRDTPDRGAALTAREDRAQLEILLPFEPALVAHLTTALMRLNGRDVAVYLSPVSGAQRRLLDAKGLARDFSSWRAVMAEAARSAGARFYDLADVPDFDDFDPTLGSSHYWFDNLHYKPVVGDWILRQLGRPATG